MFQLKPCLAMHLFLNYDFVEQFVRSFELPIVSGLLKRLESLVVAQDDQLPFHKVTIKSNLVVILVRHLQLIVEFLEMVFSVYLNDR